MRKIAFDRLVRSLTGAILIGGAMLQVPAMAADEPDDAPLTEFLSEKDPPGFDTPEKAVEAFKFAVTDGGFDQLAELLGLDPAKAKTSGDAMDTFADIQAGVQEKVVVVDEGADKIIEIGNILWPLPFPIVRHDDGKWAFDTLAGLDEIADRHVGENELETIDTLKAYVDAQEDYASQDRDGDGVLEYAQKLISSEGAHDGLYWPAEQGDAEQSPAGPALADGDAFEKAKAGEGYHGYRYRILGGQGDNIAGGKYDYVINGNMIAGHGVVAWPVRYGITGVKTFLVNKNGIIYEADLGENTPEIASRIRTFNPNDEWDIVQE
ncbi:DUF2950 domain-containing protein [Rhizobium sp. TRM96647]|uniref:DUF2950 domain-containing protein n=1 Tax=unclassified Rhizobium TaxID=2613769 RepID=UPI0021E76C64|nr:MULTISPECIES: DUF2950 domain-containing protein [unclassified Rhizobium]MCV3738785.1 DUF2950 domain-containing protein [Rhizobium sp. TRM96647]MCV3760508.1 DUF2950 domain-containing protein [Rhizobium sp. TRM96650]